MTNAAYNYDREDAARSAALASWGVDRTGLPPDRPRRRPLGLAPVLDGEDKAVAASWAPAPKYEVPIDNRPATRGMIMEAVAFLREVTDDSINPLAAEVAELRSAIAALRLETAQSKAALAEAKAKVGELSFITERLSIDRQGPPGQAGPRGRDGRDGVQGLRGPQGAKGEPGGTGPRIVSWETNDAEFTATPLLSDGHKGGALHLLGMFQEFDAQTDAASAQEEADAAAASRAQVEREAEAVRLGLPPPHWTR